MRNRQAIAVRNLEKLFEPRSVAFIGATPRSGLRWRGHRPQFGPRRVCQRIGAGQPARSTMEIVTETQRIDLDQRARTVNGRSFQREGAIGKARVTLVQ